MEDEKYQKELFEFEKPKRRFRGLARMFPKADLEGRMVITLTLERTVFISIGIIMAMVAIYAFGVERGKALKEEKGAVFTQAAPVAASQTKSRAITPVAVKPIPAAVKPITEKKAGPYTILALTLTRKETALAEVNRLRQGGFDAFMAESNSYYLVCIGAYPNKDSAESKKALSKIRQLYRDAYFKLR